MQHVVASPSANGVSANSEPHQPVNLEAAELQVKIRTLFANFGSGFLSPRQSLHLLVFFAVLVHLSMHGAVSGEIFGHNRSRSWCLQVQPGYMVTSFGVSLNE